MTYIHSLDEIASLGVAAHWPSRKAVIRSIESATLWEDEARATIEYNSRTESSPYITKDTPRPFFPSTSYIPIGARKRNETYAPALKNQPWERPMIEALGYLMLGYQLDFFIHRQRLIRFPDHPQPLRSMSWVRMAEDMAMLIVLGRIDEGMYLGYLSYACLNQSYQLEIEYQEKHRRGHVFMLRLFALWRGDAYHQWPPYGYDQPVYEGILERWRDPDPEVLRPWLIAACDYHTHESRFERSERKFYDFSSLPRTPLEILLLFRLRELIGLQNPVLDHPLMEAPYDRLPDPQPPYEPDEYVIGTLKRLREDWPIYDEVVSLEAIKASAMPATSPPP